MKKSGPSAVRGLAMVAPVGTHVRLGNENNMSANGTLDSEVHVKPLSAEDGLAVDTSLQKIRARVPGWLIHVFRDAGSAEALAAGLPERINVSVLVDVQSRRLVSIDIEQAIIDCEPYRHYGLEEWKHVDSVLAPVRNAIAAPKQVWRALKRAPQEVKEAFGSLRPDEEGSPPKPSWKPQEVVELRRTSEILALRYELHPKERETMRRVALESLPVHAQTTAAGRLHPDDFEALVMQAEVATTITPEEAAEFRRLGVPPPTPDPPG
jgi:hypothetical protein